MRLRYLFYVILLLALFSWIGSLAGLAVSNLISADGLRWLLVQGLQGGALRWLPHVVVGAMALGGFSAAEWKVQPQRVVVLLLLAVVVLSLAVMLPESPLRGIGGGLWPSPFSHSWWLVLCLLVMTMNVVLSKRSAMEVVSTGLGKYARLIVLFLIFAFLYNEITYIWK